VRGLLKSWDELMRNARRRMLYERPRPPAQLPCRMVLTLARNGNGRLNVRCECMAGTVSRPRPRYYNYDTLGERLTFDQARELWRVHRNTKGEDHGQPAQAG
jgi:hypothetical protein